MVEDRLKHLEKEVLELRETIHGNGKEGLKTDVALIKTGISSINKELKTNRKLAWGVLLMLVSILGTIIGLVRLIVEIKGMS